MIVQIVFIAKCVVIGDANHVEKKKGRNAKKLPKTTKKREKDLGIVIPIQSCLAAWRKHHRQHDLPLLLRL